MRFVRKNKKRARSRVIVTFSLNAVSAIYWQDLEKSQERLQRKGDRHCLTYQTWKQSHISLPSLYTMGSQPIVYHYS